MEKLILIGAGGHAKSVIESVNKKKYEIYGFIDEKKKGTHVGIPILGEKIEEIDNFANFFYFVTIGDIEHRKLWFKRIIEKRLKIINIIDPSAIISSSVKMGVGNFIGKMSIINADVEIGDNNIINTKALIEHECRIGNHNHISTNSVLNGGVIIGNEVFAGSSSVFNGQLKIGDGSTIGSGSVVIKEILPFITAVGVPAKIIKVKS